MLSRILGREVDFEVGNDSASIEGVEYSYEELGLLKMASPEKRRTTHIMRLMKDFQPELFREPDPTADDPRKYHGPRGPRRRRRT